MIEKSGKLDLLHSSRLKEKVEESSLRESERQRDQRVVSLSYCVSLVMWSD
ncbi:hypothetical protein J6590_000717 [Homalodisca vitripennis]|nr:hypothetical protein J6590_000717 [Homalodisca vitripennis]